MHIEKYESKNSIYLSHHKGEELPKAGYLEMIGYIIVCPFAFALFGLPEFGIGFTAVVTFLWIITLFLSDDFLLKFEADKSKNILFLEYRYNRFRKKRLEYKLTEIVEFEIHHRREKYTQEDIEKEKGKDF